MPAYNGNGEMPVLIDSNVFTYVDAQKCRSLLDFSTFGLERIPLKAFTIAERNLLTIAEIPGIVLIPSVKKELIAFRGRICRPCPKGVLEGNGSPYQKKAIVNNGGEFPHITHYIQSLDELINSFSSFRDPRSDFSVGQGDLYELALSYANRMHVNRQEILSRLIQGSQSVTLGEKLNTDNQLIATAIALASSTPAHLLTYDKKLKGSFYAVERAVNDRLGRKKSPCPVDATKPGKIIECQERNRLRVKNTVNI